MWVPGQTIDKDVYAVNTGNIAAFVKENVSGKLTVEYENTVGTFNSNLGTYVKLTPDEIALTKAGGYLIWNDAGAENGPVGTGFTPNKAGNYVFRRAIENNDPLHLNNEKYTLEGYYFDGTDCYKIRIANYMTGQEDHQRTAVTVNADGTLAGIPQITYVVTDTVVSEPVAMYYETATDGTKRLVATYTLTPSAAVNYDLTALQGRHAVELENAHGDYEFAKYRKDIAEKELALVNALIQKRNTVATAADEYVRAHNTAASSSDGVTTAKNNINATQATLGLTALAPYGDRVLKSDDPGFTGTGATGYQLYSDTLKTAITNFETKYNNIYQTEDPGTGTGYEKALKDAFETLKTNATKAAPDDDATLTGYINDLRTAYSNLDTASDELYRAYYDIVTADKPTGLDVSGITTYKQTLGGASQNGSYMKQVDDYKTNMESLISQVEAFMEARRQSDSDTGTEAAALNTFKNAVDTYQTEAKDLLDAYWESTPSGDLVDLYSAYKAKNNQQSTEKADADYNKGKGAFLTNLKGNTEYYLDNYDTTTEFDINSITAADALTAATAIQGYGLDKPSVEKTAFHIHLDNNDALLSTTLEDNEASTLQKYNNLQNETVSLPASTDIKIFINLDKDVETNWKMDPASTNINNAANAKEVVSFYLNSILDEGETSAKLIDSVTLDPATKNTFKNLTFDLDVTLDSAQITYGNDQKTITTEAVTAPAFTLTPSLTTPTDINTTVTWAQ